MRWVIKFTSSAAICNWTGEATDTRLPPGRSIRNPGAPSGSASAHPPPSTTASHKRTGAVTGGCGPRALCRACTQEAKVS